ncbi:MAG: hypothetical protein ACI808_000389 [Paraglaciecola sp.]|jgi:hypothetical protein
MYGFIMTVFVIAVSIVEFLYLLLYMNARDTANVIVLLPNYNLLLTRQSLVYLQKLI